MRAFFMCPSLVRSEGRKASFMALPAAHRAEAARRLSPYASLPRISLYTMYAQVFHIVINTCLERIVTREHVGVFHVKQGCRDSTVRVEFRS